MATVITHTIKNVDGDYSTLVAWESAQDRNLVTADEIAVAECYNDFGDYLTQYCRIFGWTTDETRYIKIYAPEGQRHNGTPGTGFRVTASGDSNSFILNVPNVQLEGIEIKITGAGMPISTSGAGVGWCKISHCLMHGNNVQSKVYINYTNSGMKVYFWNNFIYGIGVGVRVVSGNPDVYIYNCSIFDCLIGVETNVADNTVLKNTACLGCSDDVNNVNDFHADSDYNAGTETNISIRRVPGANSLHSLVDSDNFKNVGAGTEDLHLKDNTADIYNVGTDLSTDPDGYLNVSDDIDYDVRVEWSIGGDDIDSPSQTHTFTIDVYIEVESTDTFTLDTIIKETQADTFTIDTYIAIGTTNTFTLDTIIKETQADTFTIDACIVDRNTDTFTIDTIIEIAALSSTFTIDTHIKSQKTTTFTLDTSIFAGDTEITHTIGSNSDIRDYTSLGAWESAQQRDLVAVGEIEIAECYDDGEVIPGGVTINGWTTSETNYIKIYTPLSQRHKGIENTGARIYSNFLPGIQTNIANVIIDGLEIVGRINGCIYVNVQSVGESGFIEISNNLCVPYGAANHGISVYRPAPTVITYIWNNFLLGKGGTTSCGILCSLSHANAPDVYVYRNSMRNFGYGVQYTALPTIGYIIAKNNVCVESYHGDFWITASFHANSSHNASEDDTGTSTYAPGAHSIYNVVPADIFKDITGTINLHVKDKSAVILDVGIDLSSDADLPITNDIDNDLTIWISMGADDYRDTFTIDTKIVDRSTNTFTIDTIIYEEIIKTHTFTIDSILVQKLYKTFSIDTILQQQFEFSFTIDTHLSRLNTFTVDTLLVEEYSIDLDQQIVIYDNLSVDLDQQLKIKYPVPSATFQVRKPGVETLNYTARIEGISTITRKIEKSFGVSQVSGCSVLCQNSDGKHSYLATTGDYYPDHRFIWVWARIKSGWGVELDQDLQIQFQGKVETLELTEGRKANFKLADVLRELLDEKTSSAITFNDALVASSALESLNPIHISKYLIEDVLNMTVFNMDTEVSEDACDVDSFDTAFENCAEIEVNATIWPANSSVIEMIQDALRLVGGWIWIGRDGKFRAKVYSPFDIPSSPKEFIGDETSEERNVINMRLAPSRRDVVNYVTITYGQAGTELSPVSDIPSIARYGQHPLDLNTKWEVNTADLETIADRIIARYSEPINVIAFDASNLTEGTGLNVEIGEIFVISTDTAVGITNRYFMVVTKLDDLLNRSSRIGAHDIEELEGKFAMACSEIDEGDGKGITANDFDLWIEGFGFSSQATSSDPHYDGAPYPGFDEDGNQNGVVNPDYGTQDYHSNGIEEPFIAW